MYNFHAICALILFPVTDRKLQPDFHIRQKRVTTNFPTSQKMPFP